MDAQRHQRGDPGEGEKPDQPSLRTPRPGRAEEPVERRGQDPDERGQADQPLLDRDLQEQVVGVRDKADVQEPEIGRIDHHRGGQPAAGERIVADLGEHIAPQDAAADRAAPGAAAHTAQPSGDGR